MIQKISVDRAYLGVLRWELLRAVEVIDDYLEDVQEDAPAKKKKRKSREKATRATN